MTKSYSRMTFYEFVDILRGYFGRDDFYAAVIVKPEFSDDYLNFVRNERFMNFVNSNTPIKPGVINIVLPEYLVGQRFNALLMDSKLSLDEISLVVNSRAENNIVIFGDLIGVDEVTYLTKLRQTTKTSELVDILDTYPTYLELELNRVCRQPARFLNCVEHGLSEVYQVSLLMKKPWNQFIENSKVSKTRKKYNTLTDVKNGSAHLLYWLIDKMTCDYVENEIKPDDFTLFFKRPYYVVGQNSVMRKLSVGDIVSSNNIIEEPFSIQKYEIIGFKLKKKVIKNIKGYDLITRKPDYDNYKNYEYLYFKGSDIEEYLPD